MVAMMSVHYECGCIFDRGYGPIVVIPMHLSAPGFITLISINGFINLGVSPLYLPICVAIGQFGLSSK
jgi:hypothetical protein